MAKSTSKNTLDLLDYDPMEDFPFEWECMICGKTLLFTEKESEKRKIRHENPKNYDFDFFIPCPSCEKGFMQPSPFL